MKMRLPFLMILLIIFGACAVAVPAAPTVSLAPTFLPPTAPAPTAIPPTPSPTIARPTLTPFPQPSPTLPPAWEWPRSSPEEQGISSARLAAMLETVQKENQGLHSVLVIRHGVLVLEAYVHPFNGETRHSVYSVTKSVTSALVGIAREDGLLGGVDTPVYTYFPSVTLDDPRKQSIRMEHLLSMTSGIEWSEPLYSGLSDLWGILEADDPAQYFFNPALLEEPGAVFNYNSGGSHLLSMLVQGAAGQPAADFAAKRLFTPLDIRDFFWKKDFTGHSQGGAGLELKPVDMAKIGQMYLDGGKWQGQQIISADWVNASSAVHSIPSAGLGYGYQWWVRLQGDYYALGWGGQQIRVFPQQDMVVVFTSGMSGQSIRHDDLVDTYLIPAVASNNPLPADPQGTVRLEAAVAVLARPRVQTSTSLPPLAHELDGKQWLVTGRGDWSIFSLTFLNDTEARLNLEMEGDSMPLAVGLDGEYRITDTKELGPVALLGYWEAPDTFVLVQQNLREADRRVTHIQFAEKSFKLFSQWFVEPHEEESEGVLFGS